MIRKYQRKNRSAFTLIEAVISMALGGAILAGMGAFAIQIRAHRQEALIVGPAAIQSVDGPAASEYALIPSVVEIELAINYHYVLQQLIDGASAVYVFGGVGEQFADNPTTPVDGLRLPPLTDAIDVGDNLGFSASTAGLSRMVAAGSCHAARLVIESGDPGAFEGSVQDPADFSMILVTGIDTVIGLAQVRRSVVSGRIFYATTLTYNTDYVTNNVLPLSAAAAARAGVGGDQGFLRYDCTLLSNEEDADSAPLGVGATHYWFRNDGYFERYDQAAVRVVFPDPYALQATDNEAGFSRFSYFQSIHP